MTNASIPDEIRDLVDQRRAARDARDWTLADSIRDRLAKLGWQVEDGARGSTARPILPRGATSADPGGAHSLDAPATVAASVQVLAEDHPDDLARFLRGVAAHVAHDTEVVVVANGATDDVDAVIESESSGDRTVILRAPVRLGWADARNMGLLASNGEMTVVMDTSIEPVGDFLTPLLRSFDDPAVGIAGPWGVTSDDGREFEEAPPGEVDAIEAYCLAVRRDALRAVRGFDARFRFYRNADLDLSFAVRDAGWRAIRTAPLPLVRHEHRGYTGLPEAERDRLSRRNFYRFRDRWGGRGDLLVSGRAAPSR